MRQTIYILTFIFFLNACSNNGSITNDVKSNDLQINIPSDTLRMEKTIETKRELVNDSLIYHDDSLFSNMNLVLTKISKKQFQSYKSSYKISCEIDSGKFIKGSGIYVRQLCNEICETYLYEYSTNRRMLIPSDYDGGILSMLFSPSCSQLIVCSSYDGPDYVNYYDHRAEIFIFSISSNVGLHGIQPQLKYYTKDWSIDEVVWVSDNTIALKLYEEQNQDNEMGNNFIYFKAKINK